ncbi:hypothetical protein NIES2101_28900 [Calothrix sp. HK-06]|nr:hypothetical protein NIES2101_28900 [Calothrix sp. HK-06]
MLQVAGANLTKRLPTKKIKDATDKYSLYLSKDTILLHLNNYSTFYPGLIKMKDCQIMTSNKTLSVLLFVSMTFTSLSFLGKEALAGDFGRTCGELNMSSTGNGIILSASCRDRGGQWRPSLLNLSNGIGNADGRLVPKSGAFEKSCRILGLSGTTLQAQCQQSVGGLLTPTDINLNDFISNEDGRLKFDF